QRAGADGVPGLRALLHGDEECRLAAIDGLLRLRAVAELPHIVAAARDDWPLVTALAATAVRELWPETPNGVRASTLQALQQNRAFADLALPGTPAAPGATDPRWRVLAGLAILATALFQLWRRERLRLRALPAAS